MPPFPARSGVALLISIGKEVESKMNEKEVAEIRRRFRPQQTNITKIRGCCVNGRREILSEFSPSLALMDEAETEKFLAILKKTLSGTLGKNLIDLSFATQQVVSGEEHKLLMKLRSSLLEDEEAVHAFYEKIVQSIEIEGTYLILLACDRYDVPYRGKDGESLEDASSEMFTYILCSICPIKLTKPALSYQVAENEFHNLREDWLVSAPEAGFLFPALTDAAPTFTERCITPKALHRIIRSSLIPFFAWNLPLLRMNSVKAFKACLRSRWRRIAVSTSCRRCTANSAR